MQPTASKTTLLLNCARPFEKDVEVAHDEAGEAAQYGTTWHAVMHSYMFPESLGPIPLIPPHYSGEEKNALLASVSSSADLLRRWLAGDNPWGEVFRVLSGETSRALRYSPGRRHTRKTSLEREAHTYELRNGEIGGTDDLLVESAGRRVILDYKTGDYGAFDHPAALDQMLTLALMTGATAAAILHAPRGLPPIIYADDIDPEALREHSRRLRAALARAGDGSMRPGKWCQRCPARLSCPAQDAKLIRSATSLVRRVSADDTPLASRTPEDLGHFHQMLGELTRLAARAREEIRIRVEAGEVIERPDGKTLVMIERQYERLSKSSIVEALGKQRGEKLLAELRALGVLTSESRAEMHAK